PGAGQPGGSFGVRHQLALAVPTPSPVVEGAGDFVALDGALRQVAAHVPAVAIQNLDVAVGVGEDHQHGAEDFDPVRLTVEVVLPRSKAVPAPRVPIRQCAGVDL